MAEAYVENTVSGYAVSLGWRHRKVKWVGRDGAPDRLYFRKGDRPFFIEYKDEGEPVKPHQAREHKELREQGVEVFVVDNVEDGMAIFDAKGPKKKK